MKKRIISAVIILIVTIGSLLVSKDAFGIYLFISAIIAMKEVLATRESKKKLEFISFISYVITSLLVTNKWLFNFNLVSLIILDLILFFTPIIFYNNDEKYNIMDACYLIGMTLLIGISLNGLLLFRIENIFLALLVYVVCYITDTYAYIGGSLIGKHKLTSISPKKTWEGSIIATVVGSFITTLYLLAFLKQSNILLCIIISIFLTIVCQFGDLIFSSIKRHFKIKDFSNLIPGHGGMLDRLDSIIFVSLMLIILSSLI